MDEKEEQEPKVEVIWEGGWDLERIDEVSGRRITVTKGDRMTVTKGQSESYLHEGTVSLPRTNVRQAPAAPSTDSDS